MPFVWVLALKNLPELVRRRKCFLIMLSLAHSERQPPQSMLKWVPRHLKIKKTKKKPEKIYVQYIRDLNASITKNKTSNKQAVTQ